MAEQDRAQPPPSQEPFIDGPPPKPPTPFGRCGVIVRAWYQRTGANASACESRWGDWVASPEGAYERHVEVGPDGWTPPDLGWFADKPHEIGLLVLSLPPRPQATGPLSPDVPIVRGGR